MKWTIELLRLAGIMFAMFTLWVLFIVLFGG